MRVPGQGYASTLRVSEAGRSLASKVDLGYYLGGRWMCRSLRLVGMKAGTKQSKNYHFIGSATGHVIVAGAHGADAVSRGCKPQHMPLACIVACRSCRRRKASHARRCASVPPGQAPASKRAKGGLRARDPGKTGVDTTAWCAGGCGLATALA